MDINNKNVLYRSIFFGLYYYFGGVDGITSREDRLGMTDQIYVCLLGIE